MNPYQDYPDNELLALIQEESEEAKDILYEKYKYIIGIIIKKYTMAAKKYKIEYSDLYQEALLGFSDALYRFNDTSSLKTFITLCVDRRLQVIIRKASSYKNKVINESLSLEHIYNNQALKDIISDDNKNDPLTNLASEENKDKLLKKANSVLSASELEVFYLMIEDYSVKEIAEILKKNVKQIDNAMQRIKHKIKKLLN